MPPLRNALNGESTRPLRRREFLRVGLAGMAGLSLPGLFRLRSAAGANASQRTAVILVWLRGGCSHLDTYDPKPLISSDFRGPFAPIATRVGGLQISELLPGMRPLPTSSPS